MQNSSLIIISVLVGLLLVFIAFFVYKKNKKIPIVQADNFNNINPLNKEAPKKNLSLKERIELSWKFLYDITELIVKKFSKEDIEVVSNMGHILLDNGMRYEHVVDLEVKQQARSRVAVIEQQAYSQSQNVLGK